MTDSQKQIFERYVFAGAISRDPDAVAALFTEDGVYEAPLAPARMTGRAEIRAGVAAIQRDNPGEPDLEKTGYVLHETTDPDVFIVEIDSVVGGTPVALVQIFRVHEGRIASLRDYFRAA